MADTTQNECVLGIDVGGTSIKAGLFTTEGKLVDVTKIPTGALVGEEAFARVTEGLHGLVTNCSRGDGDVVAVGLDVPGPVDDQGRVGMLPNIQLDPEGLMAALTAKFPDSALAFVNDANAAALGELWQGSGKGFGSFVMVTLGTGVGGGVIVNGRLVSGAFGAGGEIGHITVEPNETLSCGCGRKGCLEQYASAKGLVRMYREQCAHLGLEAAKIEHATDTISVFEAYKAQDPAAIRAVGDMCDKLGLALAQISCVIDPAAYLIGGGVAGAFDLFGESLSTAFRSHCLATSAGAKILPCSLGNKAGMYGVAYAALQQRRARA